MREVGCIKVQEDLKEAYWARRVNEQRYWCWMLVLFNLFAYQLPALLSPKSEVHWVVNLFYTVCSMVHIFLLSCSYKSKKRSAEMVMCASVLLVLRMIIRLADIEQTRPKLRLS